MDEVIVAGLVTGWAIAVPIGGVGAFLVTLTARTSLRVGAAAALGIASVDGAYALLAVLTGAAISTFLAPAEEQLRHGAAAALLVIAGGTALHAMRADRRQDRPTTPMSAARAYWLFVGITALNPATVVYFASVVLGNRGLTSTGPEAAAFVMAAFIASASWQLLLTGGGAALGRVVSGPRGRLVTGLTSALVIAALAMHTLLS